MAEKIIYMWHDYDIRPAPADHWIVYRSDDGTAIPTRCLGVIVQEEVPIYRETLERLTSAEMKREGISDRFDRRFVPADFREGGIGEASDAGNYVGMCHVEDLDAFYRDCDLTPPGADR